MKASTSSVAIDPITDIPPLVKISAPTTTKLKPNSPKKNSKKIRKKINSGKISVNKLYL